MCELSQSQNAALVRKSSTTFPAAADVHSAGAGFQCRHVVSPLCLSS